MTMRGAAAAWLAAGIGFLSAGALRADDAQLRKELADRFDNEVKPLLAKYCVGCHKPEKKEGELDLARWQKGEEAVKAVEAWETAARRIRPHEMPPEGARQFNDQDRGVVLRWIEKLPRKTDCNQLATDETQNFYKGVVMSRRINRSEYNRSVRDLVGLDLHPADDFPKDGSGGEGFDTDGDALFTSAILMEKYLEAADRVLDPILPLAAGAKLSPSLAKAQKQVVVRFPDADGIGKTTPADAAREVIERFARRAYRRPVQKEEVDRLLGAFNESLQRKASYTAALRTPLKAILMNPNFLFLAEPEPAKEGVYRLPPHPLAARLAAFLWSTIPDEELSALADSGKLLEPETLRAQVRRMLADPKADALGETFGMQWLGLEALGESIRPDPKKFPEFDARLAAAMRKEPQLFFAGIFRQDRSLVELVDADYTYVNERLAKHYGLTGVKGDAFQRVALTDPRRGGVLGMAAVLTVTSYPLRTSPVLRGRWVLDELLGAKVPPPPPGAGELPKDDAAHEGLSFRQQLELHRKKPECASCHNRMDPLGFGLENFDPVGRWREKMNEQPIDASGKLPSGEQFSGPKELKTVLLKRKDELVKHLARKMYGFALGRELNRFDQCSVDETMKALRAGKYKASILIERIVESYPFQYRYCKK